MCFATIHFMVVNISRSKMFFLGIIISLNSIVLAKNQDQQDLILQWWTRMSVQKPVKCMVNPEFLQDFPPIAKKILKNQPLHKLISNRKCGRNEGQKFYFKGKVDPNKWRIGWTRKIEIF